MQIVRLEAENIKRLSAVRIDVLADSGAVVIAGENESGKSSTLDAIEMALAGERVQPPEPIRRGQEKAYVVVDLGDVVVTRRFTAKGSSLTVANKDGLRYPAGQTVLDGFYSKLTFDPLTFATAKADEQARILRQLAGLDTSDLDDARKKAFEARTIVNRDVAKAKVALTTAEHYPDVTEPQDASAIAAQLGDAERLAAVLAEADKQVAIATGACTATEQRLQNAIAAEQAARRALEQAEEEVRGAQLAGDRARQTYEERVETREQAKRAVPDTAALRAQLASVQEHNRKVDANARRDALAKELADHEAQAVILTTGIEKVDAAKAQRLADARFPVDGLSVTDTGVTWQGLPFEQASTAIRTRVSAAIGFALNPKLKILLVRNGNDLDGKNLQLLADIAKEHGGQVWIERIAGGNGLQTVVIEDGAVKGAPAQEPASQPIDARAHAGDGDAAVAEAGATPKGPRRRSAAGLFEEGAAK
jgi:hypothetical protein